MKNNQSIGDFQILQKLGSGSFSVVYRVKRIADEKEYALKKVELSQLKEKERQNALNEVRLLASLNNEYIVAYKDAFIDEETSSLCIVMELLSGGDLQNRISQAVKGVSQPFNEQEIWRSIVHMVKGLKSLHEVKVVHRDLKCANVFLSRDGKFKLGDLNVSKVAKMGLVYTQTGTPYYASPEVWRDEPYDTKSDIWSLGCVLYEMATLKPPFRAQDMEGLFRKVQKGAYDVLPSRYSKDLAEIIASMLRVKPSQRPSCDQILLNPSMGRYAQNEMNTVPDMKAELLKTIQLPNFKNARALRERLPKNKYDNEIKKTEEKVPSQPSEYSVHQNKSTIVGSSITPERNKSSTKVDTVQSIRRCASGRPGQVSEYQPRPQDNKIISNSISNKNIINSNSNSNISRSQVYQSQSRPLSQIQPTNNRYQQLGKPVLYSSIHGETNVKRPLQAPPLAQSPFIQQSKTPNQHHSSDLMIRLSKEPSAREIIQNVFQANKAQIRKSQEVLAIKAVGRPLSSNLIPDHGNKQKNAAQFNIITNSPYNHYYPCEQMRNQISDQQLKRKAAPMSAQERPQQKYKLSEVGQRRL